MKAISLRYVNMMEALTNLEHSDNYRSAHKRARALFAEGIDEPQELAIADFIENGSYVYREAVLAAISDCGIKLVSKKLQKVLKHLIIHEMDSIYNSAIFLACQVYERSVIEDIIVEVSKINPEKSLKLKQFAEYMYSLEKGFWNYN